MGTDGNHICARCRRTLTTAGVAGPFHSLYCADCAKALSQAVQRLRKPAVAAAEPASRPVQSAKPVQVTTQALPETDLDGIIPVAPPDPSIAVHTRICDNCSKTVNAAVSTCAYCGFDAAMGLPATAAKAGKARFTCKKCKYDMTGLRDLICPECGTRNRAPSFRANVLEEESKDLAKWAYLRPLIMLGAGLAVVTVFRGVFYGQPMTAIFYLIKFAIDLPTVMVVYVCCGLAWIGFDMPLHLIALRLAGIFAVTAAVQTLLSPIPPPILSLFVACLVYVALLSRELDLELPDAMILAVLSGGLTLVVYITLILKIAPMLGL